MAAFFLICAGECEHKAKEKTHGFIVRRPYASKTRAVYSKVAARRYLKMCLDEYDSRYYLPDELTTEGVIEASGLPEEETLEDLDSEEEGLNKEYAKAGAGVLMLMGLMGLGGDFGPIEEEISRQRAEIEQRRQALRKRLEGK